MSEKLRKYLKQNAPFDSDAQSSLLNLFVAASYMKRKIEVVCAKKGISFNHYNILRILRGAPASGYSRGEIIERTIERGSDMTRLIDRLVKKGLVERTRCESDRRRAEHRITSTGATLLSSMDQEIRRVQKYFASRVKVEDRKTLSRICDGIYPDVDSD